MISQAGWWTQTPSTTPLQLKNWNDSFLDYSLLLMIGRTEWWTQTPSTIPLQPKKWNAHFWITFNFWWLARLVDGLEPHPPPVSSQKNEILIFVLHCTSDDQLGWLMDLNPMCHPSPAKKMKWSFLDFVQLLMISQAGQWTQIPSTTPLHLKKWNAHFCITFNIWCWPDWSMDSNPIHHPSAPKKWNASFVDYALLLMIGWAGRWTQTPSTNRLQPMKWNPHFCIMLNFWWSARLVDGLEPHLPLLSSQKNEMLIFGFCSTSDDWLGWLMDSNPIHHPSPPKKMKCYFMDYVQFLMITGADQWTQTPSSTSLQPKKWNAHFCITFNIWCWPDWSMDLNLIQHPSPANKMKCSYFDYVQLLMTGQTGQWTRTPSTTALQPKKMKCSFLDYVHFWWSAGLVHELEPHLPLLSCQKNEMLIFWLRSTSDDQPGWLMDSKPICHTSPANKMKCSYFDYVQLLMISQGGWWTQTPSATPLQPKKWNAHFCIMFNF